MKINNLSLPHPVLGIGDDVSGKYKVNLQVALDSSRVVLIIEQILLNKTLEKFIEQGKATYSIEVNCPKTLFRESFMFTETRKNIELNADDLRDQVEVGFFINATTDMSDYRIDGSNPDYGDNCFDISQGDVLAHGGRAIFMASKKWEDLKSVGSFMVIDKYNKQKGPVKYDLSSDKIVVKLSESDYERYKSSKNWPNISKIYHTAIVYPALIHSLNQMFSDDGESNYSGLKWFDQLNVRLNGSEFAKFEARETNDIPEIAQMLLDNPTDRTLDSIVKILNRKNEDEEV